MTISARLDSVFLPTGRILFSEGDAGDQAYLILSGEIEIWIERDGKETVLARRGAGDLIGEMALLDNGDRSASARVSRPAEVVAISKRQLEQRLADTDPFLRMVLSVVISRYRETLKRLDGGSVLHAPVAIERISGADFATALGVLTLEREIETGLARDEFQLYLQPIVRLRDRALAGFEALARWQHPTRGLLLPSQFIAVAENSGLVIHMTTQMLRQAARAVPLLLGSRSAAAADDADPLFVSVNVSAQDLVQPGFADEVMEILRDATLLPVHLKLEVTESMLMKDPGRAGRILTTCRSHGVGIAVDDFGTGYSSLSHLSTLPITTLKIDRCFVRAMVDEPKICKIVDTIRLLARELAIPVVAEGIESEVEAAALHTTGCEYGQGYLFGRPMPLAEAIAFTHGAPPCVAA